MFNNFPLPTLFAHRGARTHAPENTLAAFKLALTHGADGIELDVKLSADQQVIVIHDQTVDRTTNGTGNLRDLPLSELKRLEAGSFFSPQFAGEPIPTLDEVFEALGKELLFNVELTNYDQPTDPLPEKVAELVRCHALQERVMFSSFHPEVLNTIRRLLPDCPTGLLLLRSETTGMGYTHPLVNTYLPQNQAFHPELSDVTLEIIESEHRAGRRVHPWTANDPLDIRRLLDWRVDGIITDDPLLARRVFSGELP